MSSALVSRDPNINDKKKRSGDEKLRDSLGEEFQSPKEDSGLLEFILKKQFKVLIVDESHCMKNHQSKVSKAVARIASVANRVLLLSGTPALARPAELHTQVYSLRPDVFPKFTEFTKRYCDAKRDFRFGFWNTNGCSNVDELHGMLKSVMLRRLKRDVLTELPPKRRQIVTVDLDKDKLPNLKDLRAQLDGLRSGDGLDEEAYLGQHSDQRFEQRNEQRQAMMQFWKLSGDAKMKGITDYIGDLLEGGVQKFIIFAHHIAMMDKIGTFLTRKKAGFVRIDGSTPAKERQRNVEMFQKERKYSVALLGMTSAGQGITLTAATTVVFAELHWTPGVLLQAEDRAHRIGQHNAVNVVYIISKSPDSFDDHMWRCIARKVNVVSRLLTGQKEDLEAEQCESSASSHTGVVDSDQHLSDFFADELNSNSHSNNQIAGFGENGGVPPKGDIRSFFGTPAPKKARKQKEAETVEIADHGKTDMLSLGSSNISSSQVQLEGVGLFGNSKEEAEATNVDMELDTGNDDDGAGDVHVTPTQQGTADGDGDPKMAVKVLKQKPSQVPITLDVSKKKMKKKGTVGGVDIVSRFFAPKPPKETAGHDEERPEAQAQASTSKTKHAAKKSKTGSVKSKAKTASKAKLKSVKSKTGAVKSKSKAGASTSSCDMNDDDDDDFEDSNVNDSSEGGGLSDSQESRAVSTSPGSSDIDIAKQMKARGSITSKKPTSAKKKRKKSKLEWICAACTLANTTVVALLPTESAVELPCELCDTRSTLDVDQHRIWDISAATNNTKKSKAKRDSGTKHPKKPLLAPDPLEVHVYSRPPQAGSSLGGTDTVDVEMEVCEGSGSASGRTKRHTRSKSVVYKERGSSGSESSDSDELATKTKRIRKSTSVELDSSGDEDEAKDLTQAKPKSAKKANILNSSNEVGTIRGLQSPVVDLSQDTNEVVDPRDDNGNVVGSGDGDFNNPPVFIDDDSIVSKQPKLLPKQGVGMPALTPEDKDDGNGDDSDSSLDDEQITRMFRNHRANTSDNCDKDDVAKLAKGTRKELQADSQDAAGASPVAATPAAPLELPSQTQTHTMLSQTQNKQLFSFIVARDTNRVFLHNPHGDYLGENFHPSDVLEPDRAQFLPVLVGESPEHKAECVQFLQEWQLLKATERKLLKTRLVDLPLRQSAAYKEHILGQRGSLTDCFDRYDLSWCLFIL
jgi:hypothetical protein